MKKVGVEFDAVFLARRRRARRRSASASFSSFMQLSNCSSLMPPSLAMPLQRRRSDRCARAQIVLALEQRVDEGDSSARAARSAPPSRPATPARRAGSRERPAWPCRCRSISASASAGCRASKCGAMRAGQRGVFDDRDRRVGLAEHAVVLAVHLRRLDGHGAGCRQRRRRRAGASRQAPTRFYASSRSRATRC